MAKKVSLGREFIKAVSKSMGIEHLPIRSIEIDAKHDNAVSVRVESRLVDGSAQIIANEVRAYYGAKLECTVTNGDNFSCTFSDLKGWRADQKTEAHIGACSLSKGSHATIQG